VNIKKNDDIFFLWIQWMNLLTMTKTFLTDEYKKSEEKRVFISNKYIFICYSIQTNRFFRFCLWWAKEQFVDVCEKFSSEKIMRILMTNEIQRFNINLKWSAREECEEWGKNIQIHQLNLAVSEKKSKSESLRDGWIGWMR
jgi:hypothetical protein